ncbi:MAG: response regulator transcription factor [Methylococcaceae bacterium]
MSNNNDKTIRILLANDQELVIAGVLMMLQSELDFEIVGIAKSFEDTLSLSQQFTPHIILFDCMLQEKHCLEQLTEFQSGSAESSGCLSCKNCLQRIPELLSVSPSSKILILTACLNQEKHILALRQGAIGIFLLNQPIALLVKAIHKVCSGEVWLTNSLAQEMLKGFNQPASPEVITTSPGDSLTPRELTIACLVSEGNTAKQIAEQLFISEKTVRNQLVIIYSKLGVQNHIELVLNATSLGLRKAN